MPSIRDFSGGVLNQELQNRDNGGGVLFDCKNVLSSWNGELRKRTGTRLLQQLEGDSKIIPYRLPDGDDMLMVLQDKVIKCYKFDDNNILTPYLVYTSGAPIVFPTSGWASNVQGDWTVSSNATNPSESDSYRAIECNLKNTSEVTIAYTGDTITSGLAYYELYNNNEPFVFKSCKVGWRSGAVNSGYRSFGGDGAIIQYSDDGINWTGVRTKTENSSTTSWTETLVIPNRGTYTYYFTLQEYDVISDDVLTAHKYWRILFSSYFGTPGNYSGAFCIKKVSVSSLETQEPLVFNDLPYEQSDFDAIRWCQNGSILVFACANRQPYEIKIEDGQFVGGLFSPSDYTGLWSAIGYPACVTFYQNRLWFGGFQLFPTRVYASEFGKFDKFTIPTTVVATSPIMADGTEISGVIENMWGGNNALYCLSEDGISMIDAQGAIVATNQVEFKLRNREPVNSMVPTVKDDIMIYLGRDKRKILVTDYDFVVQRFKARCISDNYNDFLKSGIKELHYIPRKSSLIYGSLENGQWFSLLFDIDKGKNALFPFETSGQIKDIQPIKHGDETKLVILTYLPSYQYVLEEKLAQPDQDIMDFMSIEEKKQYTKDVMNGAQIYLDHSITRHMDSPASTIGNLPYFPGDNIDVIADGNYLGKKEVLQRESSALWAWQNGNNTSDFVYTNTENPTTSSTIYDANYSNKSDYTIDSVEPVFGTRIDVRHPITANFLAYKNDDAENTVLYRTTYTSGSAVYSINESGEVSYVGLATSFDESELVFDGITYTRDYTLDRTAVINIVDMYYKSTDNNITTLPYYIDLENEVNDVVIGVPYDSYAVLKFVSPYNLRKFPKEISVNFINSGYLEVGNTFDSLKSVLNNLVESVTIDNKKILMNGNYTKTLDKQTFETPYVIVRSDKGLPFIITGIDYKVDMSNYQGGV